MIRNKSMHRDRIIKAATEEFLNYGFKDASVRRIAAAAGMSAAGLYKHFERKEDIFSALVEPAYQGFMDLISGEVSKQSGIAETGDIGGLDNPGDARIAIRYIYDNLDAFKLIVCKSQGTKYETFLHDLAVLEEKVTVAFMEDLKKQGVQLNDYSMKELHLLTTANINAIFQTVEHDFSREEAIHYADTLDRFYGKAWGEFFGY